MDHMYRLMRIFVLILICSLILPSAAFSQAPPEDDEGIRQFRKKVSEKIAQMDESKIRSLDRLLAEALQHYYQKEYGKALAMFEDISETVETLDLMFWTGTSAAKAGKLKLAEDKFLQMLAVSPELHRVRLELADVYMAMGRLDDAEKQLLIVKDTNPPAAVVLNIDRRLAAIEKKRGAGKTQVLLSASVGCQYDSNISAGPDREQIDDATNTITLEDDQQQTESLNIISRVRGTLRRDIGDPRGAYWYSALNFYYLHSTELSKFHYMSTDLSTGPWLTWRKGILKLPVGYTDSRYGNMFLSRRMYFNPSFEYFFSRNFSLAGGYRYTDEDYPDDRYTGYDYSSSTYTFGPNFFFNNKKHIISPSISFENRNADLDRASFTNTELAISYFTRLPYEVDLLLKYRHSKKNYDGHSSVYSEDRDDTRDTLTAVISRKFFDRYFASLEFLYMDNDSNQSLYEFEKLSYTLNVGVTF